MTFRGYFRLFSKMRQIDSFGVTIGIKIPFYRVLVTIEPGRSLLQFVTTNCLKNVSKMNDSLEISTIQCATIGLKINVKKTKSLRPGINGGEELMLGKENIDQVDSFICQCIITSKDSGRNKDLKSSPG